MLDVGATYDGPGPGPVARFTRTNSPFAGISSSVVFAGNRTTGGMTNLGELGTVMTDNGNATYKGSMYFSTANGAALSERMRIDSSGNVGIGTTAPGATLDVKGHVANSGPTATIGTCGTSPAVTGNDTRGVITLGTGSPTACTITFASAYATTPICVITPTGGDTGAVRWSVTPSTSALVVNFSATPSASQQFAYQCMQ